MATCLILSGGAARGALQVAVTERVGQTASVVVGTSVGAINGAAVSARRIPRIRPLWEHCTGAGYFQNLNPEIWNGLHNLNPLHKLMKDEQMLFPVLPFYVGLFDPAACKPLLVQVKGSEEHVWEAVRASASIPAFHEAVQFDGRYMNDGGVHAPLPPVPDGDFDEIHAVFCTPDEPIPVVGQKQVSSALEQTFRAVDFIVQKSIRHCLGRLKRYKKYHPSTKILVYRPSSWAIVGDSFDAEPDTIHRRLNHGDYMADHPVEL